MSKTDSSLNRIASRSFRAGRYVFGCLLLTVLSTLSSGSNAVEMRNVTDLREEAAAARSQNLVLLLEFSSDDCPYCRKLENLFLLPMQRNASYDSKVLIRMISLSDFDTVIDFDGNALTTNDFASRYGVDFTPTLLFLDADGTELSERLVGIWSEDFYGWFIDTRIDEARSRL